jgi:hypothetical protein
LSQMILSHLAHSLPAVGFRCCGSTGRRTVDLLAIKVPVVYLDMRERDLKSVFGATEEDKTDWQYSVENPEVKFDGLRQQLEERQPPVVERDQDDEEEFELFQVASTSRAS